MPKNYPLKKTAQGACYSLSEPSVFVKSITLSHISKAAGRCVTITTVLSVIRLRFWSNLTYAGLTKQGELDADIENNRDLEALAQWFDDRWNDRFCIDITKELTDAIDNSWASEEIIPPYYIYLKTAYHLSADARSGVKEFTLPPEFQRELFDFQQMAVKIAARHLNSEKRGGAMIGDVSSPSQYTPIIA